MLQRRIWLGLLVVVTVGACGSSHDEEPAVTAVAELPAKTEPQDEPEVVVGPKSGGTVIAAGPYAVEVVPHASGQVHAYVLGDPPPPNTVELTVKVPVVGRSTGRPVRLRWSPRHQRYEGRVRRVEIIEGPLEVLLVVEGVEYHGRVDVFVLFPAIEVRVIERRGEYKSKYKFKGKHRRGRYRHRGAVIEIR